MSPLEVAQAKLKAKTLRLWEAGDQYVSRKTDPACSLSSVKEARWALESAAMEYAYARMDVDAIEYEQGDW